MLVEIDVLIWWWFFVADSDGVGEEGGVRAGQTALDRISHSVDLWLLRLRGKENTKFFHNLLETFMVIYIQFNCSWHWFRMICSVCVAFTVSFVCCVLFKQINCCWNWYHLSLIAWIFSSKALGLSAIHAVLLVCYIIHSICKVIFCASMCWSCICDMISLVKGVSCFDKSANYDDFDSVSTKQYKQHIAPQSFCYLFPELAELMIRLSDLSDCVASVH